MIDQPAAPAPFALVDAEGQPIILEDLRWPFDELGAKNVPRELPLARPDVQLSIAMLAAMKNGVPTLVKYDDAGRALAVGDRTIGPNFNVPRLASSAQEIQTSTGTEALELKMTIAAAAKGSQLTVVGVQSNWTYYNNQALKAGSYRIVVGVDPAQDRSVMVTLTNPNAVVGSAAAQVTLVKATEEITILSNPGQEPAVTILENGRRQAYDLRSFSGPAAGVVAGVAFAAVGGISHEIDHIAWSVVSGGAGGAVRLSVVDNGATIWEQVVGIPTTANLGDHDSLTNLGIRCSAGSLVQIQFSANLAGAFEEVSAACYDVAV